MRLVEQHARRAEHSPGHAGFEDAIFGEGGVRPADEAVVAVPGGLAVTEEAEVVRGIAVYAGEGAGFTEGGRRVGNRVNIFGIII